MNDYTDKPTGYYWARWKPTEEWCVVEVSGIEERPTENNVYVAGVDMRMPVPTEWGPRLEPPKPIAQCRFVYPHMDGEGYSNCLKEHGHSDHAEDDAVPCTDLHRPCATCGWGEGES